MLCKKRMCPKGFEPPTHGLEGRCSIQLSYGHMKVVRRKLLLCSGTHTKLVEYLVKCSPMDRTKFV